MRYQIKWKLYIFSVLFFVCGFSFSQDNLDLITVLKNIETQHGVTFNYNPITLKNISIAPPSKSISLDEKLTYLSLNTSFDYIRLKNNIITIKRKSNMTFCGLLIDKDSQKPIAHGTIQTNGNYYTSDNKGQFIIPKVKENQLLKIKHFSYYNIDYNISKTSINNNCTTIILDNRKELLNEVVISSYLTRGINKLENGSLQIDFKDFSLLPGLIEADVLKSTQSLPGIESIDETVSNINIRGGANDQNLIIWDDIKMYQTGHFFGLISSFNPQITRKSSVIKNGTSSQYTDGVSGTLSLNTDQTITDQLTANIGINLLSSDAFIDIPLGQKSSIQIAGRRSLNDFFNTPTYDSYFDRISQDTEVQNNITNTVNTNREFKFYDISFRWLYQITPKDRIRLNFITVKNNLSFQENANLSGAIRARNSSLSQNSIAGGLNYSRTWNPKNQTTLQIHETDYLLRSQNANVLQDQRFTQENIVSETSAKILHKYDFSTQRDFTVGYHFVETGITNLDDVDNPRFRRRIAEVIRTHAVFGQADLYTPSKKTILQLGLRYNYIEKFKMSILEPRLNLTQKINSQFSLELQGEFKHQNTSQIVNFQNDFLGIERFRWQLTNDTTIPIIKGKQISLGLNYSKKGWLVDLTGYYKKVNGITSQSQGFETKFEFERAIGSYEVSGVDFLIRKKIKNLSSWLSYSFMNNQYRFKSLESVSFPSNFNIPHSITIGTTYDNKKFKISGGLNWRSGKPTTSPILSEPIRNGIVNFDLANSNKLPNYFSTNISSTYQIIRNSKFKIELGASILNITNQRNIISNFFRINTENNIQEFKQESLGITANGLLRVSLF